MRFESKLRRLAKKLPEKDVPSELHQCILSQLPPMPSRQKGYFTMKMILIPALALAFGGGGGILFVRSTQTQPNTAQRTPVQTGPITLHVVDEVGKPIAGATVNLSRYEKPDSRTGVAPPLKVSSMPVGTTNESGDLELPPQGITNFQVTSLHGHHLYAIGEITVSEGQQVITLSEHPVHSITGQFVDEKGKPLAGVQPELYVGSQLFSKLMTGPDGHFIGWVVPGTAYYLVFHRTGPGNPIEMKRDLRVEKGQFLDLGVITVRSGTPRAQ
ncbi:hypothetical protein [Armatimonas sp.]|uniref:hypothetical protein n=1 Tax=Armatimonas sp. TaxID=1872638 RepID=UPI0037530EE7